LKCRFFFRQKKIIIKNKTISIGLSMEMERPNKTEAHQEGFPTERWKALKTEQIQ
jgi:hypothetical protein